MEEDAEKSVRVVEIVPEEVPADGAVADAVAEVPVDGAEEDAFAEVPADGAEDGPADVAGDVPADVAEDGPADVPADVPPKIFAEFFEFFVEIFPCPLDRFCKDREQR